MLSEEEGIEQIKLAYVPSFSNLGLEPRPKLEISVTKTAFRLLIHLMCVAKDKKRTHWLSEWLTTR